MDQILIVRRVISWVVMLKTMYPLIYRRVFQHVSRWEKVFLGQCASHDVITQFVTYSGGLNANLSFGTMLTVTMLTW